MRSNSRAAALERERANEAARASKDLFRAVTAFMSMPARWACDFTSAFESANCRPDPCCDPCPPQNCDPCDDPCEPGCSCDSCSSSCAPSCGTCSCGGRGCSKCGHGCRRIEVNSWVEMNGGRVAVVQKIDGGFVDVKFDEDEKAQRYTKSSIRRVLQPPLGNNKRVLTKLGLVGKIEGYNPEARTVKIRVFGQPVEIDKCLICEVLPEDPPPPPESS